MNNPQGEKMGSVKDLVVIEKPTENKTGIGEFIFSDRYSVFDWGEMPNHIKNKGAAICMMSAYFFEKLEELGIKTHYIGVVENEEVKKFEEVEKASNRMRIKLVRVLKPSIHEGKYDYSIYRREKGNFLIPLEIIYRNSLPAGSSVFRRLEEGSLRLEDIGLKEMPKPGQKLEKPILDVSTKLEITDRYISWNEAGEIAGLSNDEIEEMKKITMLINDLITKEAKKAGLTNEDGKVEYGFDEYRNMMVVDVIGTPDECRFTFDSTPISKEITRIYYRNTPWYEEVKEAKKKDRMNWKKHVSSPPPLPPRLAELISMLYQACCNEITGRSFFDAPSLREIVEEIKDFI